jgi:hypothetical protein
MIRIDPHREVAAGRRRPAERGQLAGGVGNGIGALLEQAGGDRGWKDLAHAVWTSK